MPGTRGSRRSRFIRESQQVGSGVLPQSTSACQPFAVVLVLGCGINVLSGVENFVFKPRLPGRGIFGALRQYRFGLLQQMLEEENKTHVGPSSHHHRAGVVSDCHTAVLLQALKERAVVRSSARSPAGYSATGESLSTQLFAPGRNTSRSHRLHQHSSHRIVIRRISHKVFVSVST